MTQKAIDDFVLVFNSSWAGFFVKLKPPHKISRFPTTLDFFERNKYDKYD